MPRTPPEPVTPQLLRGWPLPEPNGSKYGRGTVLVLGGSRSTPGAAMLAGLAALRVGAGVLSLAVAASVAPSVAAAVPESSVIGLDEDEMGAVTADGVRRVTERLHAADAVLVGPGLDDPDHTREVVHEVLTALRESSARVHLDAFALGVLPELEADVSTSRPMLLSPNEREASRLLERDAGRLGEAAGLALEIADRYAAVVAYERHIANPQGQVWTVPSGHEGLGTSGSGDVLAGVMAGLSARGAEPAQAACWATYLHSAAGDRLAARVGRLGFLARELVEELPQVLTELAA